MAKYSDAVAWIADNDSNGDSDALETETVSGYVTTLLVADVFGKDAQQVAADIVARRKKG